MGNIYMGEAIAKGASNIATYNRDRPEREARVAEARSRKELAETKTKEYRDNAQNRKTKSELEAEVMQGQLKSLQQKSMRDDTTASFKAYEADGEISHLNNMLKNSRKNPYGKMYETTTAFDELTDTPEYRKMLAAQGITDLDGFFTSDIKKQYVVARMADGEKKIINLDGYQAAVGYRPSGEALARLEDRQKIYSLAKYGIPYDQMNNIERTARAISEETGEAYGIVLERLSKGGKIGSTSAIERMAKKLLEDGEAKTMFEAYQMAADMKSSGSAIEREYRRVRREQPDLSETEARDKAQQNIERRTTKARDVDSARNTRASLDEVSGGDYFNADLSDPKLRQKISPLIAELEAFSGKTLSAKDRDRMYNIRKLMSLGATAGEEINDEQTGFIDNTLHNLKKYMSDSIVGVRGTAAYATFRNVFRHALFGSALTEPEIKAFNEAVGTLKQQKGPVLEQLKVQMESLQTELQTLYDMNDQHLAYYYSGQTKEDMARVITQMERRIDFISSHKDYKVPQKKVETTRSPEDTKKLLTKHLGEPG